MNIVHIAAELSPLANVGGLAEAVFGLLHSAGKKQNALVILPYYACISKNKTAFLKKAGSLVVECKGTSYQVDIFKGKFDNFDVVLLKEDSFFGTEKVYGYKNDLERFLFLSKSALEYLTLSQIKIDILHVHDWHAAATLPLYQEIFSYRGLKIKKTVLSIHNLSYQGLCSKKDLEKFGLKNSLKDLQGEGASPYNILKGGIALADKVIAVSPSYAKEILEKKNSCNLYKTLHANKKNLTGLLNGIDTSVWNPKTDPFLPSRYSTKYSLEKVLQAKKENKQHLYKILGMESADISLISFIGRLADQKGLDLLEYAIDKAKKGKYAFILLGSSLDSKTQRHFEDLKKKFLKHKNIHLHLCFDEKLAHLLYASSDFLIVPSKFEPCGLVQLIAFHYATIPIVRKTGGLKDTVIDESEKNGNGYLFDKYNKKEFDKVLERALKNYQKNEHLELAKQAFSQNYSWDNMIKKYSELYTDLINS